MESGYVQIGVTALRDPMTGGMFPAVPLYVRQEDVKPETMPGLMLGQIARDLAEKMDGYLSALRELGMKP